MKTFMEFFEEQTATSESMRHDEIMTLIELLERAGTIVGAIGEKDMIFSSKLFYRKSAREIESTLTLVRRLNFALTGKEDTSYPPPPEQI